MEGKWIKSNVINQEKNYVSVKYKCKSNVIDNLNIMISAGI
jgi:hypothetical protein